jgi:hypothetical protein
LFPFSAEFPSQQIVPAGRDVYMQESQDRNYSNMLLYHGQYLIKVSHCLIACGVGSTYFNNSSFSAFHKKFIGKHVSTSSKYPRTPSPSFKFCTILHNLCSRVRYAVGSLLSCGDRSDREPQDQVEVIQLILRPCNITKQCRLYRKYC